MIYKWWLIYKNIVFPVLARSEFKSIPPNLDLYQMISDLSYLNKQQVHSLRKTVLVWEKIMEHKT